MHQIEDNQHIRRNLKGTCTEGKSSRKKKHFSLKQFCWHHFTPGLDINHKCDLQRAFLLVTSAA